MRPRALEFREGDHLCLIGNTLAERMQHFNGWETLLHQRFPSHPLVVRNLAWPARLRAPQKFSNTLWPRHGDECARIPPDRVFLR